MSLMDDYLLLYVLFKMFSMWLRGVGNICGMFTGAGTTGVPTDQKYSLKESLASIVVCWNVSALSVFLLENLLPLFLIGVI